MRYLGLFLILLFIISCKKDTEAPVVYFLKLNGQTDTLLINLDTSSKYFLETQITDNDEINQTRFFSAGSTYLTPSDSSFFSNYIFSYSESVNSNAYIKSDTILIPSNTSAGIYNLNISAVDKSSNEGTGESVLLWIFSSESPTTTLSFPDFSSGIPGFNPGDTIRIDGTVQDNFAVYIVNTGIFDMENNAFAAQNFTVADTVITSWDFQTNNAQLILPTVMDAGHYLLKIETGDNDGNLSFFIDTIYVN